MMKQKREPAPIRLPVKTEMAEWKCPYCGCTELLEGYQHTEGQMMPKRYTLGIAGSRIRHLFCAKCGYIAFSQVCDTTRFQPYNPKK